MLSHAKRSPTAPELSASAHGNRQETSNRACVSLPNESELLVLNVRTMPLGKLNSTVAACGTVCMICVADICSQDASVTELHTDVTALPRVDMTSGLGSGVLSGGAFQV